MIRYVTSLRNRSALTQPTYQVTVGRGTPVILAVNLAASCPITSQSSRPLTTTGASAAESSKQTVICSVVYLWKSDNYKGLGIDCSPSQWMLCIFSGESGNAEVGNCNFRNWPLLVLVGPLLTASDHFAPVCGRGPGTTELTSLSINLRRGF